MKQVVSINYAVCRNCGICVRSCRNRQISFVNRKINVGAACTGCGLCAKACPFGAIITTLEEK